MCAFTSQRAIRQALLGASQAARGTPSVGEESVRPLPLPLSALSTLRPKPNLTSVPLRTGRRRGAARQARVLDAQGRTRARRRASASSSLHSGLPPLHALTVSRSCSQAAVRRALEDLKAQGRPQDAAMKRVRRPSSSARAPSPSYHTPDHAPRRPLYVQLAIIAAINELRLSADCSHAYGAPAHSLAHRSASRVELSSRQQAQYGRRYAGL